MRRFTTNKRRNPATRADHKPPKNPLKKNAVTTKKAHTKLTPAFGKLAEAAPKHGLTIKNPGQVMAREGIERDAAKQMFVDFILYNKKLNGVTITESVRTEARKTADSKIRNQYNVERKVMQEEAKQNK
ncbi:MAG: hypothetical protein V1672_01990 [Candidatus Diapherotrites archaeon]